MVHLFHALVGDFEAIFVPEILLNRLFAMNAVFLSRSNAGIELWSIN